ncbi:PQQ-dependent dehydrogenase, methanol/ethanol family [Caulobacter sp. KR2-114]|uniref:PQQ-dependent dehydrogenase, methanol/ethanol family n=1 Tax=Caulobacter sp. KR2-114 TaxID=3400912 RepID=UPI003C03E561
MGRDRAKGAQAKLWAAIALGAGLLLGACHAGPKGVDATRLNGADADAGEWMTTGRTYSEQRFSPLTKVNADSVGQLGLAWHHEFDTDRGQEATPLMADGVLYTTTAWSKVFAFDAKSGQLLWSYDPKVDGQRGFSACCDVVNRGVAVWGGKVFVGALDGRLIALDAKTGKVDWSVVTVDQSKPYTITGAPRVIKGKVLIGNGGAEYGVRGYLSAYDAATGKLDWRFYMTPNPDGKPDGAASDDVLAAKAQKTWGDGVWKHSGGGGTPWDSMAYDPDLNLLYVGTGNGSPWNAVKRSGGKGDDLFLSSIVALNPDTGAYVWHYQTTPGESWDYTATQHIILADLTIDGKPRKVLMQAPKNGFFYVLDRQTGQLISAKNYITINWAKGVDMKTGRPIEDPAARFVDKPDVVLPAPYGGHNWQPMAYDPKEGLVYIPAMEVPFGYGNDSKFAYHDGAWNVGIDFGLTDLPPAAQQAATKAMLKGMLIAWDPVKQQARWTVQHPYFWNAGVLATAGGLVFQGAAEGKFSAYAAKDGKLLWSYDAGNGVVAAPMTYEIDGEQYVAVMVGYGGAAPLAASWTLPDRPRLPGRLLVFKIGGKDTVPAYPKPAVVKVDLTGAASSGNAEEGRGLFLSNCSVCHGPGASGTYLPNLRNSPMIVTADNFKSVVLDGARRQNGMVSFAKYLTPAQVESIRAYLLQQARAYQAAGGAK